MDEFPQLCGGYYCLHFLFYDWNGADLKWLLMLYRKEENFSDNGFLQSRKSNLLKNIKTAFRNGKNSRFSASDEQKIFFWWANNIDFDCKRYWFREQMIMISWEKSRKTTAKDMVLGLLTLPKCFQKLTNRSFPTVYANPFKTRVFSPDIEFRDKYARFNPQNSKFIWQMMMRYGYFASPAP